MAAITGVELKQRLEAGMVSQLQKKCDKLCVGKSVTAENDALMRMYNYWVITDQCALTDAEVNCIVNDIRTTCNFELPRVVPGVASGDIVLPVPAPEPVTYVNACAYSFHEFLGFVHNVWQGVSPATIPFNMSSLIINGTEYIPGSPIADAPWEYLINLNHIPSGNTFGKTYTRQVDFMNEVFTNLGITQLKAQVVLNPAIETQLGNTGGLYILSTVDVLSFEIVVNSDIQGTKYTENGIEDLNGQYIPAGEGVGSYERFYCTGLTITDNVVDE